MSFPVAWTSLPAGAAPGSHVVDQPNWDGMRSFLAADNANRNAGGYDYSAIRDLTFRRQFTIAGGELARNNSAYNFLTQAQGTSATPIQFAVTSPGGTMTAATPVTLTLTPVPPGVNGTDAHHYLYISGGTGAAEAVLITGGTAVAGSASGTIVFTPANNHSGAWKIGSATSGIQEAVVTCGSNGCVEILEGNWSLYAGVWIAASAQLSIRGKGQYVTFLRTMSTTGDWVTFDTGSSAGVDFGSLAIVDNAGTYHSAGTFLKILNRPFGVVSDVYIEHAWDGIKADTNQNAFYHNVFIGCANKGLYVTSTTQSTGQYYAIEVSTNDGGSGHTAIGIEVEGPTAGITFACCTVGSANFMGVSTGANALLISQNANGPSNELQFVNCIFDGHDTCAKILGYGSYVNNRILFSECGFNGTSFGMFATSSISGLRMSNCTMYGATAGLFLSDIKDSQVTGCAINGVTAGVNTAAAMAAVQFVGNSVGVDNLPSYGFAFGGTQADVVMDNKLVRGSAANYLMTNLSGLIWDGDSADDTKYPFAAQATVADAATVTFPYNLYFTLSGTGTAVTALLGVWPGRSGTFRCTNASPPQFTAGATIGKTFTPTQNVMVRYYCDHSGVVWLN